MTAILGISAFYHDSAASLLVDGEIIAAAQEERFTRIKHDSSFPKNAINYVLKEHGLKISELDDIVFFEKPFLKFERLLETYLAFAPKGFISFSKAIPIWLNEKIFQKKNLFDSLRELDANFKDIKKIKFSEHHLSHAASAFFPSPFEKALIFIADGVGEWPTTTVAIGDKNKIQIKKEINFPHSLGLMYSAFTYYCGFKVNSGEYKLMGLAPYGEPIYVKKIYKMLDLKKDGSYRLDQSYFNYATGLTMTSSKFHKLFGALPRNSEQEDISQFHMDIAASIQKVTEEVLIKILINLKKEFPNENLCLAGGVALNCVANGKIIKEKIFENIWIQPAAGDSGGSLGAALALWFIQYKNERVINKKDKMKGSFLGPQYNDDEIESFLNNIGAIFVKKKFDELIKEVALDLSKNKIVGWFQDRMEFGPRALGNRSIIANPKSTEMQKNLNLKIKFRESFRPFAPSILKEYLSKWFDSDIVSPYMLIVSNVIKDKTLPMNETQKKLFGIEKLNVVRSEIPAVTHVDYSARIQTVCKDRNKKYYELIDEFRKLTGCPILINTSFNVRGEPIVNTPGDAFRCFMGTDLDILVLGNYYLKKKDQKTSLQEDYKDKFVLD